jgi:protein-S-isoprenylcysteine O-methyltransferase Ste14
MTRDRTAAAVGSSIFFALAPGIVAGVVPWWITGWSGAPDRLGWRVIGAVVTGLAAAVLISAFARFVREGIGTPAPVAPTQELVVGGLYRWVRNPMYIAVVACVLGQAGVFGSRALIAYGVALMVVFFTFVRFYEEPALTRRFGAQYEAYRRAVPAWFPRAQPARDPRVTS